MVKIICPECSGIDFKKSGIDQKSHFRRAQRYQCKNCGRIVKVEIVRSEKE